MYFIFPDDTSQWIEFNLFIVHLLYENRFKFLNKVREFSKLNLWGNAYVQTNLTGLTILNKFLFLLSNSEFCRKDVQ